MKFWNIPSLQEMIDKKVQQLPKSQQEMQKNTVYKLISNIIFPKFHFNLLFWHYHWEIFHTRNYLYDLAPSIKKFTIFTLLEEAYFWRPQKPTFYLSLPILIRPKEPLIPNVFLFWQRKSLLDLTLRTSKVCC